LLPSSRPLHTEAIPEDRCAPGRDVLVMVMTMISRLAAIYIADVFCKRLEVSSWQTKHNVAVDSRITDLQRAVNIGLFIACRRQAQDRCTWKQFVKTATLPPGAWS